MTTLWANSADNNLLIFFLIFPENRFWHVMQIASLKDLTFHANCQAPKETISMKCQNLFSGNIKKYFKISSANVLPSMLSVNRPPSDLLTFKVIFLLLNFANNLNYHILWYSQPSLYRHSIQRQNSIFKWQFECHETFVQVVIVNKKLCKNIALKFKQRMFWIFVRIASVRRF